MKRPALTLALLLVVVSAAFVTYRVVALGYPLLPGAPFRVWLVSFEARVVPDSGPVTVKAGLPGSRAAQTVVEERFSPGSLNFALTRQGQDQVGIWSGNPGPEGEIITYTGTVLFRPKRPFKGDAPGPPPGGVAIPKARDEALRIAKGWGSLPVSQRIEKVTAVVSGRWPDPRPPERDVQAWARLEQSEGRARALVELFTATGLFAREVAGFRLADSVVTEPLRWVEVWTGQAWENIDLGTGKVYARAARLLPLRSAEVPFIEVKGGKVADQRWTITRRVATQWSVYFDHFRRSDRLLNRWSLFSLPSQFQDTFRIFLLVPIGALMICVLRNLIGFPTFGIFMPVLMALAFRYTGLVYGLAMFAFVVLVGYAVRRWLDRLRLLLVPRLSVLLTLVIFCFTLFALIGAKLGLKEFMAIGLLPFVILTMTIERFFVVIEEEGAMKALQTALGSAAVATITHQLLHIENLQLTFFIYPELLLAVAAIQILIGRYTGYRLLELIRFRNVRGS